MYYLNTNMTYEKKGTTTKHTVLQPNDIHEVISLIYDLNPIPPKSSIRSHILRQSYNFQVLSNHLVQAILWLFPTSSTLRDVHHLTSPHLSIHTLSFHMTKSSESSFSHFILNRRHLSYVSNYFIPNSIHPRTTTHSSNNLHLCYHQSLNPCIFYRPAFWSIRHSRSNYYTKNFVF